MNTTTIAATLALVLALAPLPAGAYSLTATEECWYKNDPNFRDWVDNLRGRCAAARP